MSQSRVQYQILKLTTNPMAMIPILTLVTLISLTNILQAANEQSQQPSLRHIKPSSSSLLPRGSRQQPLHQPTTGTAVEVEPPVNVAAGSSGNAGNRSTRTADIFQNGDGYNIFVTNTCERESMKVNIKTSRPFYGVIHTRNQRQKPSCSVEGNGEVEYNLDISHILNSADPTYCGVIRARRDSPEDKDILSVVVAVRVHRNIELSDDKFFLLNCTNRCRKPDCSSPSAKLLDNSDDTATGNRGLTNLNGRLSDEDRLPGEREGINGATTNTNTRTADPNECTVWNFPWVITLLWCMGILLLAMIISHCIMCSSMVCKCVKTEVEEKEPSVYEGATDYEDDLYNKRHPYRIDYDNRDIYKTSNNYAPHCLEETETKSRHHQKHHKNSSSK